MSTQLKDVCQSLEWDSAFFGCHIARVKSRRLTEEHITEIDNWCLDNNVRCLYFECESNDPNTTWHAENKGFHLVDVRLTFERMIADQGIGQITHNLDTNVEIRSAYREDIDCLVEIARQRHHDTRFYYDQNFPRARCDALYETWLRRSYDGYADVVFVAILNDAPVGYITGHLDQTGKVGQIGLIAVADRVHGRGIGQKLVMQELAYFSQNAMQHARVATQARNYPSQRLYQRCGFKTQMVSLFYHKWYEEFPG
jgi:RimJ/RimL family protein N-acetyltransferase